MPHLVNKFLLHLFESYSQLLEAGESQPTHTGLRIIL